jgi:hypothetical protein
MMTSSCPVGSDDLGEAVADYLRSIGAAVPEGMRAYVTGITMTSDVSSMTRLDVSMVLQESPNKRRGSWCSVDDQIPETDDPVLVCLDTDGSVRIGLCDEEGMFLHAESYRQFRPQPSHWMPLPRGVGG